MNGSQDVVLVINVFDLEDLISYVFQIVILLIDEIGVVIEVWVYFVKMVNLDVMFEFIEYEMCLVVDGVEVLVVDFVNLILMQFDGDGILIEVLQ